MRLNKTFFSIQKKLILVIGLLLVATNLFIGILSYQTARSELEKSGKIILKNGVKMILEAIDLKQDEIDKGLITIEEAQEEIKIYMLGIKDKDGQRPINKNIDLGEHGYFFVMSREGVLLAHPAIEGQDIWEMTDRSGTEFYVVKDVIMKANQGGDYTYYMWELPRSVEIAAKVNYAEVDPHWGWVVVSSIYLSDFNKGANTILNMVLTSISISFLFSGIVIYFFSKHISVPIITISERMIAFLNNSTLYEPIFIKNKDETGILAKSFSYMSSELIKQRTEKESARNELEDLNLSLEKTVLERTKELENQNDELEVLLELQSKQEENLRVAFDNLKNTQEKLIEAEKMATIGTLVAGVAHEINTPLGIGITVSSHLNGMVKDLKERRENNKMTATDFDEFINESVDSVELLNRNLEKAAKLVDNFKQVAVDLHEEDLVEYDMCEYTHKIVETIIPSLENQNIRFIIECEGVKHYGYPGVYSQIISKLIINTISHGFKNRSKGIVIMTITSDNEYIKINYKDDGKGIEQRIIDRIFDPFFTTDHNEGRVGLGLHIVYNLVTQKLNGKIVCRSFIDKGTEFTMIIPYKIEKHKKK